MTSIDPELDRWIDALVARHVASLRRPEFLKAVRALSARYVQRRAELPSRSPLDSAGKRAAFAAFFAPLHFLTIQHIVEALSAARRRLEVVHDLGCGSGAASAAWARALPAPVAIVGVDRHPWALAEAEWTWRQWRLSGRAHRGDFVDVARRLAAARQSGKPTAILCAWSVNELANDERGALLPALLELSARGHTVLIVEPLARSATPWWPEWTTAFARAGGRQDEWRFDVELPQALAELDDAAGFRREGLSARSLSLG